MAKLTDNDLVEIIRLHEQDKLNYTQISNKFGVNPSTIRRFLKRERFKSFWDDYDIKPQLSGTLEETVKSTRKTGSRFVITSAQNNTYVHDGFFKTLLKYCEYNDAELLISTFVYDRTGFKKAEKGADKKNSDYWYDPKISNYRCDERLELADGLIFCGELNISPTEVNPISGFHNYVSHGCSGILPHAKMKMKSLPRPKSHDPRFMYTTGAVTQRNYIQKKTGQKASIHHAFSALIVEVDKDGDWFVRQLHAEKDTGHFYDLTNYYTPNDVTTDLRILALNYGDIHAAKIDNDIEEISWKNQNSILDILKPRFQFVHDVFDAQARNHHSVKDPHFLFNMHVNNKESIRDEVLLTGSMLNDMERKWCKTVVVESNHDLALEKYLKEQDYRKDPVNAIFFLELQLAKYKSILNKDYDFQTFKHALEITCEHMDNIRFLKTDESFELMDIEFGSHGHNGNNGSRGSVNTFRMQGVKTNMGHTHSPEINDGVFCAGVSGSMEMGYNVGGTSWAHAHIITYMNGKRAIIDIKNKKWKL